MNERAPASWPSRFVHRPTCRPCWTVGSTIEADLQVPPNQTGRVLRSHIRRFPASARMSLNRATSAASLCRESVPRHQHASSSLLFIWFVGLSGLSGLFGSFGWFTGPTHQTDQIDQINKMDQTNQIDWTNQTNQPRVSHVSRQRNYVRSGRSSSPLSREKIEERWSLDARSGRQPAVSLQT